MKRKYLIQLALQIAIVAAVAYPALAQIAGPFDQANEKGTELLDYLMGPIAKTVGGIALAVIGYRFFSGKMEWRTALPWGAGCALIIGAKEMTSWIFA